MNCLKSCTEGFNIQQYVTARTNAISMFEQEINKERAQSHITKVSMTHQDLYLQLRAWRNAKAVDLGVEPHAILRQTSMERICSTLPSTKKDLGIIKGVGAKRMRQFGDELLEIMIEYLKMKGLMTKVDLNEKIQYKIHSQNDNEPVF